MYATIDWFYDEERGIWCYSVNGFISRKCYKKARWLKGFNQNIKRIIDDEFKRIESGHAPCDQNLVYKFGWNRGGKRK